MKLDDVKKLHQKKYRTQFGYYLVEGEHLIIELQKAIKEQRSAGKITLYITEQYQQWASQLLFDFTVCILTSKQMAQLSDTKSPQGIIARLPLPNLTHAPQPLEKGERCIYLHEVQDPGNLGTILRSLAWFGHFRLLLSPNSVDPFNSKVVRASMGAIFHLPIELDVKLADLASRFTRFAYLDLEGTKISSATFNHYDCYLFGNEARGVPRKSLQACHAEAFTIEGSGSIDSLNLASAVGICAYQLAQ
jgi:TrmH family RNA methyltransferase